MAVSLCRFALARTQLHEPLLEAALQAVTEGRDPATLRRHVQELTEQLDIRGWELHEAVEAGEATQRSYEWAFRKARAAHAVRCALDEDRFAAAAGAFYEAKFAASDPQGVRALVKERMAEGLPLVQH